MGWLWSSSPRDDKPSPPAGDVAPSPANQSDRPAPPASTPKTRDEIADAELQAFLEEINYKPSSYSPSSPASGPTSTAPIPYQPAGRQTPEDSISPAAIYPTRMSCRAAFDAAYHCQLPGGQFVNVYRYGQLRDCRPLWSDFWFCMRTNRGYMSEEEREKRIKLHFWEKDRKYREGSSSEDLWEMRKEKITDAFTADLREWEQQQRSKVDRAADEGGT